jgi:Glyoxalase/Bleomycin resistance protein/Dioxygenase superfamily
MIALPPQNPAFMQMCWVVPDLEAAIDGWVRTAGVGPFFWFDDVTATDGVHRGQTADFPRSTAAIAYAGDTQIELVCQENDDPGVFRDLFDRGQYGLHHLARLCEDYEAERNAYTDTGVEIAFEARIGGRARTCWVDTSSTLGLMIELLEPSRSRTWGFATMREAAASWDGKQSITRF